MKSIALLLCVVAVAFAQPPQPSAACLACIEPLALEPKQQTQDQCEATGVCPPLPWTVNPDGTNRMPTPEDMRQFKDVVVSKPGCGGCVAQIWIPKLKDFKQQCGTLCPMPGAGGAH